MEGAPAHELRPGRGQELSSLQISADGRYVVYVRGGDHGSNWDDGLPVNPAAASEPSSVCGLVGAVRGRRAEAARRGRPAGRLAAKRRSRVREGAASSGRRRSTARPRPRSSSRRAARTAAISGRPTARGSRSSRAAAITRFVGVYSDYATPILWIAPSTSRDSSRAGRPTASASRSFVARVRAARLRPSSSRGTSPGRSGPPTRRAARAAALEARPRRFAARSRPPRRARTCTGRPGDRIVFLSYERRLAAPLLRAPRPAARRCS